MSRARRYGLSALLVLTAAGSAIVVVAAAGSGHETTKEEYVAHVNQICAEYGARLDAVPPPGDLSSPGAVFESLQQALPLLEAQSREIQGLSHPARLDAEVDKLHSLTDRALAQLRRASHQASERALYPMAVALTRFGEIRDEAKVFSRRLGFHC